MGKLTLPLAAETEAQRGAYAALNRNDIPESVEAFDPQIEWTQMRAFADRRQALEWAGSKSQMQTDPLRACRIA